MEGLDTPIQIFNVPRSSISIVRLTTTESRFEALPHYIHCCFPLISDEFGVYVPIKKARKSVRRY